ncbi:MAG: HlyD family efflux transporter periplasmic adaptor subunit [Planctomicrobium sp.]|jgi:multidrug resistance efflux pump|nr:HlyD family efflux transporter periplasmic adaptor subunit [Planctomicrobium sp.]
MIHFPLHKTGSVRTRHLLLLCSVCTGLMTQSLSAQQSQKKEITATSCFLRTYEEADVPALERGLISGIMFNEGDLVEGATVMTVLDDAEARLRVAMAKVDIDIARKKIEESFALQIAKAKVTETQEMIEKSRTEQKIAEQTSNSDVAVRLAEKSLATAQADMNRALAARAQFAGSVSDAELSRLTYLRDRSQLDIESAKETKAIALLQIGVEQSAVATAEAVLQRLKFEESQASTNQAVERIEYERLRLQLELAETQLHRRKIVAPFTGMVVEQYHHRGEWLEPGEPIFRIVRLDRLVVEGYANSDQIHHSMRGTKVKVVPISGKSAINVEGTLTFVSPEIDPVNQQVQIRAIVDNSDGHLRSGQAVDMTILVP